LCPASLRLRFSQKGPILGTRGNRQLFEARRHLGGQLIKRRPLLVLRVEHHGPQTGDRLLEIAKQLRMGVRGFRWAALRGEQIRQRLSRGPLLRHQRDRGPVVVNGDRDACTRLPCQLRCFEVGIGALGGSQASSLGQPLIEPELGGPIAGALMEVDHLSQQRWPVARAGERCLEKRERLRGLADRCERLCLHRRGESHATGQLIGGEQGPSTRGRIATPGVNLSGLQQRLAAQRGMGRARELGQERECRVIASLTQVLSRDQREQPVIGLRGGELRQSRP
jgi:hypothetical protein